MPQWTTQDKRTGETIIFDWYEDRPPTDADIERIRAEQRTAKGPVRRYGETVQATAGTLLRQPVDLAIGAAKGAGSTVFGLGKLARDYTPVGRVSDRMLPGAFTQRPEMLEPSNLTQRIGFGAEQVGEFFLPTGAVGKVGRVAEAGKSGLLTLAQGGSPTSAGVSAGISAVVPGGGAARRAASRLKRGAEKTMVQALGPTKEATKETAKALAPEMLQRGVKGSREAMLALAKDKVDDVGAKIGAEVRRAAQAGETVDRAVITGSLDVAEDALMVSTASGKQIAIEGAQPVIEKLGRLRTFVEQLGTDQIPFDKAAKIKTVWDRIVSRAGLYGPKATSAATDNANAWAIREAAGAFRQLLAKGSPTLDDLNREYGFWKGLRTVLRETERRTQSHGGGLVSGITGAAGASAGYASGRDTSDRIQNAVLGGLAGRQLVRLMQSPAWRTTVSGPLKQTLANALASGNVEQAQRAVGRILAAVPARMRGAAAEPALATP